MPKLKRKQKLKLILNQHRKLNLHLKQNRKRNLVLILKLSPALILAQNQAQNHKENSRKSTKLQQRCREVQLLLPAKLPVVGAVVAVAADISQWEVTIRWQSSM